MRYEIILTKKVNNFINKLPNSMRIKSKLKLLENFNFKSKLIIDIKSMKGDWAGSYRIRIGNYRFIFKIIKDNCILIYAGAHRGKIYK